MSPDPGGMRHSVTHKSADATISVRKWMDVIQTMMRSRKRKNTCPFAKALLAIAVFEVPHEIRNAFT
jgi:hypothetical protein